MKAATHTAHTIPRQTMTKYLQFTIQLAIMFLGNQDKGGFSPSFNIRGVQDGAPQTEGQGGDEDGYILGSDPDMYTARHLGRPVLSGVS